VHTLYHIRRKAFNTNKHMNECVMFIMLGRKDTARSTENKTAVIQNCRERIITALITVELH
jgi:hypothetical protein